MGLDRDTWFAIALAGIFVAPLSIWFLSLPWIVQAEKRRQARSVQSGVIGTFDEIFHPEAHAANVIWEAQKELPAPLPLPGDKALNSGRIRIELPPELLR
ncbi:hypothetical protein ASE14_00930 [Agromyces sp. Root81]|uniref:hypothetical protein n=1 Tax=Agromyces sp. Root81 TaxID=1736601 RepID=UPI000700BF0A|nr:hypothetical protein [Agromyces sp. Root81]KRC62435.1 hypothetical protein ASE14_00930 [Agromyces sp. Root81]